MTDSLIDNIRGNYRFLTGIAPYSAAVIAAPNHATVRAVLHTPVPYQTGFDIIDRTLNSAGRSLQALCAVELRVPRPFPFSGFIEFNNEYRELLVDRDLLLDDMNPIARTNIAPAINPPSVPSLYAFSYTVPLTALGKNASSAPTFIVAGAGDLNDQANLSSEAIVRPGDRSQDAMIEKATCVMDEMAERLSGIGRSINDVSGIHVYTVEPLSSIIKHVLQSRLGASMNHGLTWFFSHPPIAGLAFEMDMRRVARQDEIVL